MKEWLDFKRDFKYMCSFVHFNPKFPKPSHNDIVIQPRIIVHLRKCPCTSSLFLNKQGFGGASSHLNNPRQCLALSGELPESVPCGLFGFT